MAFGDGGNDIPMLRHVGIGVAMGNAENDVKQVADYVTASVDEDGIEKALRHFGVIWAWSEFFVGTVDFPYPQECNKRGDDDD